MFKLQADCQVLKACCNEVLVSDSLNAIKIQFTFSGEWDGLEKTAQFTQKNRETNERETFNALIEADGIADLPNEITDGVVLISVFGVDGDVKRLTTTAVAVPIMKSGFVGDGKTPIPPTPDLYQQYVNKVYNTAGSPVIGDNGNWFLDNIDTGVKADWSAEQENAAASAAEAAASAARAEEVKASIPLDYAEMAASVASLTENVESCLANENDAWEE